MPLQKTFVRESIVFAFLACKKYASFWLINSSLVWSLLNFVPDPVKKTSHRNSRHLHLIVKRRPKQLFPSFPRYWFKTDTKGPAPVLLSFFAIDTMTTTPSCSRFNFVSCSSMIILYKTTCKISALQFCWYLLIGWERFFCKKKLHN